MQPVGKNIFVNEVKSKPTSKFETVGAEVISYQVAKVGKDVSLCKKGDFLLCENVRRHLSGGVETIVVNEDDIVGVQSA